MPCSYCWDRFSVPFPVQSELARPFSQVSLSTEQEQGADKVSGDGAGGWLSLFRSELWCPVVQEPPCSPPQPRTPVVAEADGEGPSTAAHCQELSLFPATSLLFFSFPLYNFPLPFLY